MLNKIRQFVAVISILMVTLLFLDFTGSVHHWFGWMARIQFLPAVLALNVGAIIALVALTLLFGRVYCSVICPLSIMQDGFGRIGKRFKKNRYSYSRPKNLLRYVMLALMMKCYRRHAVVVILSVAAIITPTSDMLTLLIVSAPIWLLYEAGIFIVRKVEAAPAMRVTNPHGL